MSKLDDINDMINELADDLADDSRSKIDSYTTIKDISMFVSELEHQHDRTIKYSDGYDVSSIVRYKALEMIKSHASGVISQACDRAAYELRTGKTDKFSPYKYLGDDDGDGNGFGPDEY